MDATDVYKRGHYFDGHSTRVSEGFPSSLIFKLGNRELFILIFGKTIETKNSWNYLMNYTFCYYLYIRFRQLLNTINIIALIASVGFTQTAH